ncbi:protein MAINTENANCE OF MERISTEMS-like [Carex rostrata]
MGIEYQEKMKEGLKNLGLYQMVNVHHCLIERGLITTLVERWRPETNSFHLPVGECTVTLEDVSCLWGLSVTGRPISGCTDDHYSQLILDCLGHEVYDGLEWDDNDFYYKKVEHAGKPNEKTTILKNYMRLVWLREKYYVWGGNPRRGTKQCRDQFERLKANVVNWRPYRGYQYLQPSIGIRDQAFFASRVWCIHFWMVEIHLPERVFRQFGLFQAVPPPAPPSFKRLEELRKWTRADGLYTDGTSGDWSEHFSEYIAAPLVNFVTRYENGVLAPYLPDRYHEYMEWFFMNGMYTIFQRHANLEILSQAMPEPGDVANLGYVSDAVIQARIRFRQLNQTARGISMVRTPGQKAFGLLLLESSRDVLSDLGHIALFIAMLNEAGLPTDLRDINVSDDLPDQAPINPEVHVPEGAMHADPSDILESLQNIRIDGRAIGDGGASASMVNPTRRHKKKPNKYSDSKFRANRDRERIDEDDD